MPNEVEAFRLRKQKQTVLHVAALAIVAGLCMPTAAAGREQRLKDVLSRLDAYLKTYEAGLTTLVAEERYEQWIERQNSDSSTTRRTLTSDFGFLRLPGRLEWLGLRDTFEVDGQLVPEHQGRLDRLMSDGSSNPEDLARRIVDENGRFNLGDVARTINVPMLALDLLGRRGREGLSFHKQGEDQLEGRIVWVIAFSEREHPTLVKTLEGRDRPARGTVLADPEDGAVLRTDIRFEGGRSNDSPATSISVLYRRDVALGMLVPSEMREVYHVATGPDAPEEIHALARYGKFRQFRTRARVIPR